MTPIATMLAAQNTATLNMPIIFTPLGCDAVTQAHALVKAYAMEQMNIQSVTFTKL